MTKNALLEKGQKIRAWVDPPPPIIRPMPERKRFFTIDVFPNREIILLNIKLEPRPSDSGFKTFPLMTFYFAESKIAKPFPAFPGN